MPVEEYRGVETFEVLAEPNRRRILDLLLVERPVGDLVEGTGLSQPAVSKHLPSCGTRGWSRSARRRSAGCTGCRPEPLRALDQWLAPYRAMWSGRLDASEAHLDAMPDD